MVVRKLNKTFRCSECGNDNANLQVTLGKDKTGKQVGFHLCLECAWTLSDGLEETANLDFEKFCR